MAQHQLSVMAFSCSFQIQTLSCLNLNMNYGLLSYYSVTFPVVLTFLSYSFTFLFFAFSCFSFDRNFLKFVMELFYGVIVVTYLN